MQNKQVDKKTCLLFDLDGTLTDSAPGILHSVQYALKAFSMHLPAQTLNKFIGPPLRESFCRYAGMSHADAERAVARYRECFVGQGAMFENAVYDGIGSGFGISVRTRRASGGGYGKAGSVCGTDFRAV